MSRSYRTIWTNHIYQRLLWQRILVLGDEIKDENANALCAQLILLNAEDPKADISLYINSPGGSVSAGLAIYDTMNFISNDVATYAMGMVASMGQVLLTCGTPGQAVRVAARADHDAPADGRHGWYGDRHQDAGRAGDQGASGPGAVDLASAPASRSTGSRPTSTGTAGSPRTQARDYGIIDRVLTRPVAVPG